MSERVKARRYDSSGRRQKAEARREHVLAAARAQFLDRGYAATSVASVAEAAGVSVETVYKSLGPKSALVRALWERALAGTGSTPAPERSDSLSAGTGDVAALIRGWATLTAEVSPEVSPVTLLVREAATHDKDMAALLKDIDDERRDRMRVLARRLLHHGGVRPGLTQRAVTDALWIYTSPEIYDLLVRRSAFSRQQFAAFVEDALRGHLAT